MSSDVTSVDPLGVDTDTIEMICKLNDDVYRNQLITYVYERLSRRLAAETGRNANWFTFARWSSFTVGENLRVDKPSEAFRELIDSHPPLRIVRGPLIRLQHDMRMLSDAAMPRTLALGNHMVFHEIAYAAAKFLEWYDDAAEGRTLDEWKEYRTTIIAEPATDLFQACDVEWLRDGVEAYFLAMLEKDPGAQARLVMRGNVLLAAYEQWRLEPVVALALDPVAKNLVEVANTDLHAGGKGPHAILRRAGTPWAFRHHSPLKQWTMERYQEFLTRHVMAWQGPISGQSGSLFLGRGLPDPSGGAPLYPAQLDDSKDPRTLVVNVFDHSGGTRAGRTAHNWARFTDRMNFIVNLFRAEQDDEALFGAMSADELRIVDLNLSDDNLDWLRGLGDRPVDDALRQRLGDDNGDARAFMRQLRADEFPDDNDLYGAPDLPAWKNDKQLELGQQFLCEHGLEIASTLFFASLPFSYTAARGAHVLTRTAELTTGRTTRRLAETGQLFLDLMAVEKGAPPLAPGTQASRSVRGVRLFHGAVRRMIATDPNVEWDTAELGKPINQEDLLGTLIVFTVVVVDALEKLGVDFGSDTANAERDAYVHYWLVVGHLLGIDYAELRRGRSASSPTEPPLTLRELRMLQAAIVRRQSEPSLGGQVLMASLLDATQRAMPWWLKGFPAAATRGLLGRDFADALAVPPAGPARVMFSLVRVGTRVFSPRGPGQGLAGLARRSTKHLYRDWIDRNDGAFPPFRLDAAKHWRLKREGTPPRGKRPPSGLDSGPDRPLDLVTAEQEEAGTGRRRDRAY